MAAEPKTKTQRVHADIITMLKVIEAAAETTGERFKTVEFIDSLIRPAVTERYKKAMAVLSRESKRTDKGH